jgi:spore coat protein U-like protein
MRSLWKRGFAALLLLFALPAVQAAITCNVGAPAITIFYQAQTTAKLQGTLTVSCTRTNGSKSVDYTITPDDGNYPANGFNRARRPIFWIFASYVSYDLYTDSTCTTPWNAAAPITGTLSWPGNTTGVATQTHTFWACILPQNVLLDGVHTDSVQMTMSYKNQGTQYAYGDLGVNIITPATCDITQPAGNINLDYTAFSPAPVSNSTTVGLRCTATMPYTLEILPPNGVLAGVRYDVTVLPASGSGTGNVVTHTITATAPAGQPGQCATGTCSQTQTHELRITY